MKTHGILVLGLLVAAPLSLADTPATTPSKDEIMNAYNLMELADNAREKKAHDDAMQFYGQALDAYMDLANNYPEWQTNLVRFRLAYCRDQLKSLLGLADGTEGPPDGVASPPPATAAITSMPPSTLIIPTELPPTNTPASFEPSLDPSLDPSFDPSFDPSLEPSLEPPAEQSAGNLDQITSKAKLLLSEGKFVQARLLLMEGIGIDPDHYLVRLLLGVAQCEAGRFEDALILLRTLVEENPSDPHIHIALAGAHLGLGEAAKARKEVTAALKLKPNMSAAHYNMVQVLMATKPVDLELARHHYKKALELGATPDEAIEALLNPPPAEPE